jgi:signal transduction histidine kinase
VAWLSLPTLVALLATARAARVARRAERVFWALLAAACAAHGLSQLLFLTRRLLFPEPLLTVAAHVAYHGFYVLLAVALLTRPDQPRSQREVKVTTYEWTMAVLGGYFLVAYFVLFPSREGGSSRFFAALAELVPALWCLLLAARVREEPFARVYGWLAAGLCASGLVSLASSWVYRHRPYPIYAPFDLQWMLPFWTMAVAALGPRGTHWLRSESDGQAARRRGRLFALTVGAPPFIDLVARTLDFEPMLATERSLVALAVSALLAVIVGLRLRATARLESPASEPGPEASEPSSHLLRFASGAAHELNNPLMAIVVSAEVALARGGQPEPVRALQAAAHDAAAAVKRFHLVAAGGGEPE